MVLLHSMDALVAIPLGGIILALSAFLLAREELKSCILTSISFPISIASRRVKAWRFLLDGPNIIQAGYDKAKGSPYEVLAPDARYVFVSSAEHIKEIDAASDNILSLQAAAKQMLQPKYTMNNFNWFDKRGVDGTPLVRTLRSLLTNNVPNLVPDIRAAVSKIFDTFHDSLPAINGAKAAPLYPMVKEAVAYSNALAFFGAELAQDKQFMKAAIDFIENTLLIAEILRLLPNSLVPIVGKLLARHFRSHDVLHRTLIPVTEERLRERALKRLGRKIPTHKDCIQWVMECSPTQKPWSAERIVHELMALWFGSVHVLTTTICYAVHDICLHPEYVEPLRKELQGPEWEAFEKTGKGLPLLDNFIRESSRLTPVESMSTRRQALQPFQLSDGTKIEIGDCFCTPQRAMARDPAYFEKPLDFHGFRFVDPRVLAGLEQPGFNIPETAKPSQLTDTSNSQLWGTGRMACPGRFYAAAVMKIILGLYLTKYDMELADKKAPRWFTWRSFIYPSASTIVILQPTGSTE
ncbi:hypothetical protein H112_04207 [Trichophyton rubrum D6]|uniref:Cytochrome P450 n=2 Tax=Trichophyton rubrum TaxID=5551 RepID=A0A178F2C7_TRIRU|nr:hypothetical protein H100_04213 [Trichophyton rubrum MR850]EZF42094.1 hypothetical protein H102_04201 [Trichophyton rubrum CBS 100081]EZF52749.1 hypothetical protein H103_04209 [Trichophyton rubrum CBS 288.86]EZF63350.1 hypothetical protein H104_04198 [Trichophyton rubrum CBS 289.86]EZF84662.1 hypothetical protein H110_04202 [Trichophyton rubrum MR1448]EZG16721.1 hypothetical protein H107_04327 [Trichophyton rubrum CBS 202.88]KDB33867.1 hypothetical protein H112_04207 [Trichophyton rubrum 